MGIDEVVTEVKEGGERRAQEILDQAQADASEILAAAAAAAAAYAEKRTADAARDAQDMRAQIVSRAEFDARKAVLQEEAALRTELRRTLLDGFAALPAAKRQAHVKKLLAQAASVVLKGRVWCADADEKALQAQSTFDFAGTTEIAGGIIVEDASGRTRLDLSYETLLDGMWRDILRGEAELFG
jgi:V/A-type H+-transporting ATPase subunit E